MTHKTKKSLFAGLIIFAALIALGAFLPSKTRYISLKNFPLQQQRFSSSTNTIILTKNLSPISGLPCKNYNRRPIAVMLSEDPSARPLSGLSMADLVVEMPITQSGINRMMAVYVCGNPSEIGSVRSARHDYISLAMGLDAILVHWGGSHFALDKLNNGIMDNIDALKYSRTAFWRQANLSPPHNGFTNIQKLVAQAKRLHYRLKNKFSGYPHEAILTLSSAPPANLVLGYPGIYKVRWHYDPQTNSYARWRGNKPEKDFLTKNQIHAKDIVIMRANSHELEGQYNDVDVEGSGKASFYFDGRVIQGNWVKAGHYQKTKLYFYDESGQEIKFQPGQIWIEIIEPNKPVVYQKIK